MAPRADKLKLRLAQQKTMLGLNKDDLTRGLTGRMPDPSLADFPLIKFVMFTHRKVQSDFKFQYQSKGLQIGKKMKRE